MHTQQTLGKINIKKVEKSHGPFSFFSSGINYFLILTDKSFRNNVLCCCYYYSEQAINDAFAHAQKAKLTKAEGKGFFT
jgi:hypothetical protein